MLDSIKSEFKKLLTIRSTYVICGFALAIIILFAFYIEGFRAYPKGQLIASDGVLTDVIAGAVAAVGTLFALVGALLVTHEYRYNTVMYTLTASKSRTTTFLSKVIVVSIFTTVATLVVSILAPMLSSLGLALNSTDMVSQHIPLSIIWQALFTGWGFAMIALIIAFIIRHQIGAIVAVFLVPGTVESLLGLLLRDNSIYLPYSALSAVMSPSDALSSGKAVLVFMVYVAVGWLISWQLFLRRDAN